jgi:hypothetical protein
MAPDEPDDVLQHCCGLDRCHRDCSRDSKTDQKGTDSHMPIQKWKREARPENPKRMCVMLVTM